jgi:hypothetical protein
MRALPEGANVPADDGNAVDLMLDEAVAEARRHIPTAVD